MTPLDRIVNARAPVTLRVVIKAGPIPLRRALTLAVALADALRRRRDEGSLPHALCADEVVVKPDGALELQAETDTKAARHASHYSSPEVASGSAPDERAAVWQLGALLFELLSGHAPWPPECMDEGVYDPLPLLREGSTDVTEHIELTTYRMLDTDPDLRIGSLDVARLEIEECLLELDHPPEVDAEASPTPITGPDTPRAPQSLAFSSTPLVGRQSELELIRHALTESPCRLLTLVGPGGVGKSRLAFEAAHAVADAFSEGACLVPLGFVHSPSFIVLAIGNALGFSFAGPRDPLDQLADFLRRREILLILDDFDRLVEGADIISQILEHTERPRILVTSRERLDLRVETLIEVRGLNIPSHGSDAEARSSEAVSLFFDHAQRMGATEEEFLTQLPAVVRICTLVGGLPLGIEMAAAWIRTLTCNEIVAEIERDVGFLETTARDMPEQHRSMRAVFNRSWQMLDPLDRLTLTRLAVFRGGFSREAAGRVAGASLGVLSSLVDKSLIVRDATGRWQIHELLRLHLEADEPDQAVSTLHASYFATFVHVRERRLLGSDQQQAYDEIERELPNILLGWETSLRIDRHDLAGMYVQPLHHVYRARGWYREGERLFGHAEETLAQSSQGEDEDAGRLRAKIAVARGILAMLCGDHSRGRSYLEESVRRCHPRGWIGCETASLVALADIARMEGKYAEVRSLCERALTLSEDAGDPSVRAKALAVLAAAPQNQGQLDQARSLFADALEIARSLDDTRLVVRCVNGLGSVSYALGDWNTALTFFAQALENSRTLVDRAATSVILGNIGSAALVMGDYQRAADLYGQVLELAEEVGSESGIARGLALSGRARLHLGHYDEARQLLERSLHLHRSLGERPGIAHDSCALGEIALATGNPAEAVRHYQVAVDEFRELGAQADLAMTLGDLASAGVAAGRDDDACRLLREALHLAVDTGESRAVSEVLHRWIPFLESRGHLDWAVRVAALSVTASHVNAANRNSASAALVRVRAKLKADEFAALVSHAYGLTSETLANAILEEPALQG